MARTTRRTRTAVAVATAVALTLTACSSGDDTADGGDAPSDPGDATPDAPELQSIEVAVSPSGLPVFVAGEEGLFEGIDITVSQVGYDQSAALFLAGDTPLGWIAPIEVAEFVSQGEDIRYFSTAGATNMIRPGHPGRGRRQVHLGRGPRRTACRQPGVRHRYVGDLPGHHGVAVRHRPRDRLRQHHR